MNQLPNESGVFDNHCLEWDNEAGVQEQDRISDIIQESIKMEPDEISNDEETRTGGTVEQISELSNDEILSFLRANDLTKKEMIWLKNKGTLTDFEVLRLIGQIMLERLSE